MEWFNKIIILFFFHRRIKRGIQICREKEIVIFSPLLTQRASKARHLLVQFRVVSELLTVIKSPSLKFKSAPCASGGQE